MKAVLAPVALALLLGGCRNGYSDTAVSAGFCESITGGTSALTVTCTGCTVGNQARAADGDLNSYATIDPLGGATAETASFRATAQSGVVYPVGSKPGVAVVQPTFSSSVNDVVTYMTGTEQERMSTSSSKQIESVNGKGYFTFTTTQQFDAVEFTTQNTWPTGQSPVYRVYELCHNGGAK